jgi:predicted transcriptional regulator
MAATAKQEVVRLLDTLPEDSSFDEILRELALARMIERGLADSQNGRTVAHDEVGAMITAWAG